MDYKLDESTNTSKLLSICKQANANTYLSGPLARDYIDKNLFRNAEINLEWMNYESYTNYNQLYSPFYHHVTIIDLIFNQGINAQKYMKSF